MNIIKYVPNTLSIIRLLMAISLLFIPVAGADRGLSLLFLTVYTIAGITDMIDGPIARKFKITSALGANLDGVADYALVAIAIFRIVPVLDISFAIVAVIVAGIIVLKGAGMIVGYMRFKQLMMMHTYASKSCALFAFLFPLIYQTGLFSANMILVFIGIVVYFYLLEEIAINSVMPEPRRDISGFYRAWRINREAKEKNE